MSQNNTSLKYLVSISKGKKPRFEIDEFQEGLLPYLSMDYLRGKNAASFYCDEATDSIVKVEDNDLLILWDGSNAGEIVYGKVGALSSTMAKIDIISEKVHKEFLTYFLIHSQPHLKANTVGMGIPHVNGDELRNLVVYLPSLIEQSQIAAFLDRKTAHIDTIIEKKQKLLQLLDEKKKAVINEAVTGQKVWNGNAWVQPAEVKDSGVEWIGEIPEDWTLKKIKYLSDTISKGTTPSTEGRELVDKGVRFLKSENIINNNVSQYPEFFIDEETNHILRRSMLEENDLLFVIAGASIGKTALLPKEFLPANTNQAVCFIRCKKHVNFKFLHYVTMSSGFQNMMWLNAVTSAQPNLSMTSLGDFSVPVPNQKMQEDIVTFIENKIADINLITSKLIIQIEKLKEYRQSLISEAVTGKIDLSNFN